MLAGLASCAARGDVHLSRESRACCSLLFPSGASKSPASRTSRPISICCTRDATRSLGAEALFAARCQEGD